MEKQNFRIRHRINEIFKKMEDSCYHEDNSNSIKTGCFEIDAKTEGLFKSEVSILGGRPSMGKTLLALQIVENACEYDKKTILFTNYSGSALTKRLLAMVSGVDFHSIMENDLKWEERKALKRAARTVSTYPLIIDDQTCLNLDVIRKRCKRVKKNEGLDFVVIDYLQAMSVVKWGVWPLKANNYVYIAKELEKMARELDIAILVLSSLPDTIEKRSCKRPLFRDFDIYGPITSYASLVLTLYRDEYYYYEGEKKTAEIVIHKAKRDKPLCHTVKIKTDFRNSRFFDLYSGFMPIPGNFNEELPFG